MTVTRYDPIVSLEEAEMQSHPVGDYVEYEDYKRLEAEFEDFRADVLHELSAFVKTMEDL